MKRSGFTLAELVIVMAIVLMLAAAAITGSIGLLRSLRFSNTFNKLVLMTQQARSLASSARGTDISYYEIEINSHEIKLKTNSSALDSYSLENTGALSFYVSNAADTLCALPANIQFAQGNAQTKFVCNGLADPNPPILKAGVEETKDGDTKKKSFIMHKVSGIPQIL